MDLTTLMSIFLDTLKGKYKNAKKKTILCVDDDEMVLTCLREQLADHFDDQYQYELAESAE